MPVNVHPGHTLAEEDQHYYAPPGLQLPFDILIQTCDTVAQCPIP